MSQTIYDFSATAPNGDTIDFAQFRGQPILVVNTASKCGFAYQYKGLQQLHEEYGPQGLVVVGMPSDQFRQELGDEGEIESFCQVNFGVTFPLTSKVAVNGSDTDPIFAFLKSRSRGTLGSAVKWNFTKFLVAPDGTTVRRYRPQTEPAKIAGDVAAMLEAPAA